MNDDLGRGQVGWRDEDWQTLDALAGEAVIAQAVLRKVIDRQEVSADAKSVRMAGKNVDVRTINSQAFDFDMEQEDEEDLHRKVRDSALELASLEDEFILKTMQPQLSPVPSITSVDSEAFFKAKAELVKKFVQQGNLAVVVSPDTLVALEKEQLGVRSGLEVVEKALVTTIAQSNALPLGKIHAIVMQLSPAVERITHAAGPQLRVLGLSKGRKITLHLEELIAVGVLEKDRSVAIEK